MGWGLHAAPKGLEAETGPERRKPGQVPVAALCSKGNCVSSWGRAGQGSPAGQQVCGPQAWMDPQCASEPIAPLSELRAVSLDRGHLLPLNSSPPPLTKPRPHSFSDPGVPRPGWKPPPSTPSLPVPTVLASTLSKKDRGCRRGVGSRRSPSYHLPGHLHL